MKLRSFRSIWPAVWLGVVPFVFSACANPGPAAADRQAGLPPLGIDLGGSGPVAAPPQPPPAAPVKLAGSASQGRSAAGAMQLAQAGPAPAQGTGTINSVDATARKINMNHEPIPAIGWPAMTMDFAVAPSVDLRAVKPGTRVNFQMMQGQGGMYVIQSIAPAGGGR